MIKEDYLGLYHHHSAFNGVYTVIEIITDIKEAKDKVIFVCTKNLGHNKPGTKLCMDFDEFFGFDDCLNCQKFERIKED